MNAEKLAVLEQAGEPYRRNGFVVTSQAEGSITLGLQRERFNYLLFILALILIWPAAVVYLISYSNRRNRTVCLRITSRGHIEESGYTLDSLAKDHRRDRLVWLVALAVFLLLALIAVSFFMAPRPRIQ